MEGFLNEFTDFGAFGDGCVNECAGCFDAAFQNLGCLLNLGDRRCTDADSIGDV